MSGAFEVVRCGPLVTVQDLGRYGHQRFGMPVAGAMDAFAFHAGNLLVGNRPLLAALEVPMGGLALRALEDAMVAITGADLGAALDGRDVQLWRSFRVRRGQALSWRGPAEGVWSYLAASGGINVPAFMGSRATYLRAEIGGLAGRAIRCGDIIRTGQRPSPSPSAPEGRSLAPGQTPRYPSAATARVVLGPHDELFTPDAIQTLLGSSYTLTTNWDRMGYRLEGPVLRHIGQADILSEAVTAGSIQVPANGQPIILMADRQTTGGYPQIATVVSVDLPCIAQLRPGGTVRFLRVDVAHAQDLAARQAGDLARLAVACGVG